MSQVGQREILTQKHVVQFFRTKLGYDYLGHWQDRVGNSNVEQDLLRDWLRRRVHSEKIIGKVLYELDKARAVGGSKTPRPRPSSATARPWNWPRSRPPVWSTSWSTNWSICSNGTTTTVSGPTWTTSCPNGGCTEKH